MHSERADFEAANMALRSQLNAALSGRLSPHAADQGLRGLLPLTVQADDIVLPLFARLWAARGGAPVPLIWFRLAADLSGPADNT